MNSQIRTGRISLLPDCRASRRRSAADPASRLLRHPLVPQTDDPLCTPQGGQYLTEENSEEEITFVALTTSSKLVPCCDYYMHLEFIAIQRRKLEHSNSAAIQECQAYWNVIWVS